MDEILPPSDRRWATPLSWIIGLLWIGAALRDLVGEFKFVLIVPILAGLMILPPVVNFLRSRLPLFRPFWAPPVIALAFHLLVGGGLFWITNAGSLEAKPTGQAASAKAKPVPTDPVLEAGVKAQAEADRIVAEYAAKSPGERFVDLIDNQLMIRVASVSTDEPKSLLEVWGRLGEMETLAVQVREGRATPMNEVQKKSLAKFEAALAAKQAAVFPVLRKAYREFSKGNLWERDIEVRGSGRSIEYVGVIFARNANIKAVQDELGADLLRLRFDKATYRWIRDGDGARYDLDAPADGKIVY